MKIMPAADYQRAYATAKEELAELIATQGRLAKRILVLRESLRTLSSLCDSEEIEIEPSPEAEYLLAHSTLAEDVREVLQFEYPGWCRPNHVKAKLERLGHDLGKYKNPQAMIHMVLKRMVDANEAQEGIEDGKQIYRVPPMWQSIADNLLKFAEDASRGIDNLAVGAAVKALDIAVPSASPSLVIPESLKQFADAACSSPSQVTAETLKQYADAAYGRPSQVTAETLKQLAEEKRQK